MHRSLLRQLRPFAFVLVTIASLVPVQANAQFVRAYVVDDSVTVGDHFTIVMVAEHSQPDSVGFPEFTLSGEGHPVGDVLLLSKLSTGRRLMGVGNRYPIADTVAYRATTFAIDSAVVASVQFSFVSADRSTTRQTDPFSFPVASVLTDDSVELRDIEPLATFPSSIIPYLFLLGGLLAGFVFYRWLNRPRPEVIVPAPPVRRPPPAPVESPLSEANRRLSALEETDLTAPESNKPYFVELSEILRTYIERRLHLTALESTSGELIAAMRDYLPRTPIPSGVIHDLTEILETSDLAKFADVQHPVELSQVTLSETRVLILRIEDSFRPARAEAAGATASGDLNGSPVSDKSSPQSGSESAAVDTVHANANARESRTPTSGSSRGPQSAPQTQPILFINDTDPEELIAESLKSKPKRSTEDWAPPSLKRNDFIAESSPIAAALRRKESERTGDALSADEADVNKSAVVNADNIVNALSEPVDEAASLSAVESERQDEVPEREDANDSEETDIDEWIKNAPGAVSPRTRANSEKADD